MHRTSVKKWTLGHIEGLVEIAYVKKGAVKLVNTATKEKTYVPENAVFIIDHSIPYEIQNLSDEHIHYTAAFYINEKIQKTSRPVNDKGLNVYFPESKVLTANTSAIFSAIQSLTHPCSEIHTAALLMRIFDALSEQTLLENSFENPICLKAKKVISQRLHEKISVSDIAQMLNISNEHLSRVFSKNEKITLTDYINSQKLNRVREILFVSDMTLENAGHCVGFDDVKYLSRLFKKKYGTTPREYIKSIKSTEKFEEDKL